MVTKFRKLYFFLQVRVSLLTNCDGMHAKKFRLRPIAIFGLIHYRIPRQSFMSWVAKMQLEVFQM